MFFPGMCMFERRLPSPPRAILAVATLSSVESCVSTALLCAHCFRWVPSPSTSGLAGVCPWCAEVPLATAHGVAWCHRQLSRNFEIRGRKSPEMRSPMMMIAFALIFPASIAGVLQPFPHIAGSASSLVGFVQQIIGALTGIAVTALSDGTQSALANGVLFWSIIAFVVYWAGVRKFRTI